MTSTPARVARLSPEKLALLKQVIGDSGEISEPIAVVGMGCRFAGARSIEDYWRLIRDASDMTDEIPGSRWDVDAFFDPSGAVPGKMSTRWGGFVQDIDRFDAAFFGISPREVEKMDPQHRLLLEVVWESLEYGGLAPEQLRGSTTGVFVGVGGSDYSRIPVQLDNYFEQVSAYSGTGNALSIAANRISYTLDLRGPSLAIDTACSSSLVAAHLAVRSLRAKESDIAIVAGVNAILTPETTLAFSQAQMLSSDGKCRPFDDRANGYVRGEGCGVLILKRLSDAIAASDMVLATIRGSAINQDGMTSGITAPRGTAQVQVIRDALRDARRTPEEISYVEAHGTATPLGDPIELRALAEVFSNRASEGPDAKPCYVGSVKANIGHTETAAGMASLIKTILMFRNGTIPKQVHFQNLNRHVDLGESRLQIAREPVAWDSISDTRFAGVSSFGFGGTNAHLVLEAATVEPVEQTNSDRPRHVLAVSAKSVESLRDLAGRLSQTIDQEDYPLADICHTAAVGRSHFHHRLAISTGEASELSETLRGFAAGEPSRHAKYGKARSDRNLNIAFLFTGQGAQYPGMGRQLFETQPVFREAVEECDRILDGRLPQRLLKVLFDEASDESPLHQTLYTQPALFAIEYALARLWRSFGIEPDVMIGHSIGDYVAACEAGVFSLADGLTLISHRARLVQDLPRDGMMAVVFADRERVADLVVPYEQDVAIGVHNGPHNVVISGRADAVTELLKHCELAGLKTRPLQVSHAMHSPLLEPILDEFERLAGEVIYHEPTIPLISSCDGNLIGDRICEPTYWRQHLRSTVNFVDGVRVLQKHFPLAASIEIGPGTTLCGLASRLWNDGDVAWLPSLRSGREDWDVVTETLSELYVRGADIDWSAFDQPYPRRRLVLPTYPFERQSHWYDMSRQTAHHVSPIAGSTRNAHPLLGSRLPVAGDKSVFEVTIDGRHPGFLSDHRIDESPVVPAAAYIEQALAAATSLFGDGHHWLSNLSIQQPLMLPEQQRRVVQVQIGTEQRGQSSIEVFSRTEAVDEHAESSWTLHASGTIHKGAVAEEESDTIDLQTIGERMNGSIDGEPFYELMAGIGLKYGPAFQVVDEMRTGPGESLTRLSLDDDLQNEIDDYLLHPVILDGCLQSIAGVVSSLQAEPISDLVLPTHAEQVRVHRNMSRGTLWAHTRLTSSQSETDTFQTDIDLLDEHGEKIAELRGMRVQRISKQGSSPGDEDRDLLYELHWNPQPIVASDTTDQRSRRRWIAFADADGLASEVASQLVQLGDVVTMIHQGPSFERLESNGKSTSYQINPLQRSDYEALFEALRDQSEQEATVVDFWGCAGSDSMSTDRAGEGDRAMSACSHAMFMLQTIAKLKVQRTVFLTRGANAIGDDAPVSPAQASLWGLGRTAIVEMPHLSCRLVDLDPAVPSSSNAGAVLDELTGDDREDQVALRGDERFVARLEAVPDRLDADAADSRMTFPTSERFALRLGSKNSLDGLHYEPISSTELQSGELEIEVNSAGLNFSDVLKALGLYPGVKDKVVPLGIEFAGVVSRVGSDVDRLQVGQRVMGVAPYSFASHTTTAEYAVVLTPDNVSDDEAATIPITFLTAYYALCKLARLASGEKVLIHAGAGGVGQAAIQIAQAIGAEVFATAGSESKREYLRSLGVKHVMDSRSLEFADEITTLTSGRGVDVVLNSLPGDAIPKSLAILAAYGRFLEIGKTDIYQNRRVGLWPFQDNLSYFAIDLDRMLRQRPDEIRQLFDELMSHFMKGTYRPLPLTSFAADEVVEAFRYMAQRKNVGKVVVSLNKREHEQEHAEPSQSTEETEGTVLITGGLGALGRQVAKWVARQGGTHLAILSRRDPAEVDQSQLADLQASGVAVSLIRGDVSDQKSLASALDAIPASFPPIRGVIHAAGVLDDGLIQTMDLEQLDRAMAPKTQGAWNLHQLITTPLDSFVLFSSVAGTIGSPGQANYAAGNAFLDGLASHRRQLGQPATSIAWGPWDQEGMAADAEVRRQLSDRGMNPLPPETAIDILDGAVRAKATNLVVMDVSWDKLLAKFPGRGPSQLASFRAQAKSSASRQSPRGRDEQLWKSLQAAGPEARIVQLQTMIAGVLGDVVGVDCESIDVEQPLASLGLDSLMGMELRSTLESKLGLEIPVAALFDDPSVASLSHTAAELFAAASSDTSDDETPIENRPNRVAEPRGNSALVALGGAHGDESPLFCVHPVGGDLRCYDSFARALGSRPVFGLRAQGLQPGTHIPETMDEMVGDYVATIRDVQPEGPYCLMGWSTGGIFAYEMARRLQQDDHAVQSLVMVDSPLPAVFRKVGLRDDARFLVDLVEFANYFAGTAMEIRYDTLHQQDEQQAISHVLDLGIKNGVLPASTTRDYLHRLVNVCKRHVRILQSCVPETCPTAVQLFRPEDTSMLSEATGQSYADDLGWSAHAKLHVHHVPGHHFTMMTGANAAILADKIDELIRKDELVS